MVDKDKKQTNNKNGKGSNNKSGGRGRGKGFKPGQPKKDSDTPRINADNARIDKVEDTIEADSKKENANKIEDFSGNPELMRAVSSLPQFTILGTPVSSNSNFRVPGIMTMYWVPNFGNERVPISWNQAWKQAFAYMVHANSRNYSKDFTDYGIATHAAIEVFAAIEDARRVYGVAKAYTEQNFYLVENLINAMGFNPESIRTNLSRMWGDINDLIVKTKDLWVPNVFPILSRYLDYNTYVYTDAPGQRSQTYVYVRRFYYQFSATGNDQGGCLIKARVPVYDVTGLQDVEHVTGWKVFDRYPVNRTSGTIYRQPITYTWQEFKAMIESMINAIVNQQDLGNMYGNMMNAYGPDKCFALQAMDPSYTVLPTMNAEIMAQIENLNVCDAVPEGFGQIQGSTSVGSATGPSMIQFYSRSTLAGNENKVFVPTVAGGEVSVLNFHTTEQPSNAFIVEATRMKTASLIVDSRLVVKSESTAQQNLDPDDDDLYYKQRMYIPDAGTYNYLLDGDTSPVYVPYTAGSEMVTGVCIWVKTGVRVNAGFVMSDLAYRDITSFFGSTYGSATSTSQLDNLGYLMAFDWHPFTVNTTNIIPTANLPGSNSTFGTVPTQDSSLSLVTWVSGYGDYDNYSTINRQELKRLNDACFYSLFGIPQSGFDHKYMA